MSLLSFEALEAHLEQWRLEADQRIHGTHEAPADRFARDERAALRPLPSPALRVRERRVQRRVATDCFVDVDTVRYGVPRRLVRHSVEVLVLEVEVEIFDGPTEVARHRRSMEPHRRVVDRVLHHSHVLLIQGDHFRLKQKKRAGLLGSSKSNV